MGLPGSGSFLGRGEEQIRGQAATTGHVLLSGPTFSWREHVTLPCEDLPGGGGLSGPCFVLMESSPEFPFPGHSLSVTLAALLYLSGSLCGSEERGN